MTKILDACCWWRMFWFDKNNPLVDFMDNRELSEWSIKQRMNFTIKPDIVADFRYMPFKDNIYDLVVMDPPHLKHLGSTSWMAKKYGKLSEDWREDIKLWFDECMRVLKKWGIMIFKRNETEIKLYEVLKVIITKPLFWTKSWRHGKTIWLCFIKI